MSYRQELIEAAWDERGRLRDPEGRKAVEEVIDCLQMKQDKNINRTWPDWVNMDPDKPIEHVK